MRLKKTSEIGLTAKAIVGTHVVFFGLNISDKQNTTDFLGFAIKRTENDDNQTTHWLSGMLHFQGVDFTLQENLQSNKSPIQKFSWGDYTVHPNTNYTYTVQALYGTPDSFASKDEVVLAIKTEDPLQIGKNGHQVHFNRSAASSQAYLRHFGDKDPSEIEDEKFVDNPYAGGKAELQQFYPRNPAYTWLSRGLEEELISFILQATDNTYSLHLCVYEFQKENILSALKFVSDNGVKIEAIYDDIDNAAKKPKTPNEQAIAKIDISDFCTPRKNISSISHNKFIVISKNNQPFGVWTGSTNFTDGAIYGQANVGHAIMDEKIAAKYLQLHQELLKDPDSKQSKENAETLTPLLLTDSLFPIFSPRKNLDAIQFLATIIKSANGLVCFTSPFELHESLQAVLDEDAGGNTSFLKFGLIDKPGNVVEKVKTAAGAEIVNVDRLHTNLSAFQEKITAFQAESFHHAGVHIHTKYFLIDPLSDNPIIFTGSANFSNNSTLHNDENQLVIYGEKEVADVYFTEFVRMFDHYEFREYATKNKDVSVRNLENDNTWAKEYFVADSLKEKERKLFSA